MTTWLVLIHLLTCIVLPLACAWRVWRLDEPSRSAWLLKTVESGTIVILVILVGMRSTERDSRVAPIESRARALRTFLPDESMCRA